jgi:hypothetical protein
MATHCGYRAVEDLVPDLDDNFLLSSITVSTQNKEQIHQKGKINLFRSLALSKEFHVIVDGLTLSNMYRQRVDLRDPL